MKPNFALSLSPDGIVLLHRAEDGWHRVGEVLLDEPDWPEKLGFLRKTACALDKKGVTTKLVIPNSQVLYVEIEASDHPPEAQVSKALEGRTPYDVADLAFDWTPVDGTLQIAAVARETLTEAEDFATEYGFNPVSFVASPEVGDFAGEPFFGSTAVAENFLQKGESVERESATITAPTPCPEPLPVSDPKITAPLVLNQRASDAANTAASAETETPSTESPKARAAMGKGEDDGTRAVTKSDVTTALGTSLSPSETPGAAAFNTSRSPVAENDLGGHALQGAPRLQGLASHLHIAPEENGVTSDQATAATARVTAPSLPPMGQGRTKSAVGKQRKISAATSPGREGNRKTAAQISQSATPAAERISIRSGRTDADSPSPLTVPSGSSGKKSYVLLILTAILLVLMVGAAVWVTIFAPGRQGTSTPDTGALQTPASLGVTGQASATQAGAPVIGSQAPSMQTAPVLTQTPGAQSAGPVDGAQTASEAPASSPATPQLPAADRDPAPEVSIRSERAEPKALTPQQARTAYAATGIWQRAPQPGAAPRTQALETTYIASIDPKLPALDAVALPDIPASRKDLRLPSQSLPAHPQSRFTVDARGLVLPSKEGTLNPDGVSVFSGAPPRKPPARGTRVPRVAQPEPDARLAHQRARARPSNLIASGEKARLGGRTRVEMAALRPRARPIAPQAEPTVNDSPTAQAVASSLRPDHRPRNFATTVALARVVTPNRSQAAAAAAAVAPRQTVTPRIPTRASVAKQATVRNAINLRRISLIGVYGSPSKRRALVRLRSGRYVKVQIGDRIDGGKVAAIGENTLNYIKGGRNISLKMPKT